MKLQVAQRTTALKGLQPKINIKSVISTAQVLLTFEDWVSLLTRKFEWTSHA